MPVKLGPDGKVIEEKTKKAASFEDEFRQESETGPGRPPADQASEAGKPAAKSGGPSRPAMRLGPCSPGRKVPAARGRTVPRMPRTRPRPEDRTRVYRPGAGKRQFQPDGLSRTARRSADAMDDPPVGWLVVVQGPGQGQVVTLGNGCEHHRACSQRAGLPRFWRYN